MYKCYDCEMIFEEPKNYSEDRTPGGAFEGGSFIQHWRGCPKCFGAFYEVKECDNCGEFFDIINLETTNDGKFCISCLEEMENIVD